MIFPEPEAPGRGDTAVRSQALTYAAMLFVFGLVMSGVDNWAHAGGFAGGYLASLVLEDAVVAEALDPRDGELVQAVCMTLGPHARRVARRRRS